MQAVCWTDEPSVLCQNCGEEEGKYHSEDDSSDEPFPGLIGRQCQEGGGDELLPECDAREVGRYVVDDDQEEREEEPEQSVQQVGGMELGLEHYEAHSDYGPHVLAQLEADQARLQGQDRHDEYRPIHTVADDVDVLCK